MFARLALLLSLVLSGGALVLEAQTHRSIVRGTLLDGSHAPAANIPMRASNEATGETRRFVSDDRGRFTILQVEPGSYRIESEDDRYGQFIARIRVDATDDVAVTLPLTLGSISGAIDYRSFVLAIDRDSPGNRTSLPGDFLTHLPLDGRSVFDALVLTPRLAASPGGPYAPGTFPATHTLDGFPNIGFPTGAPAVRPGLESIAQVDAAVPYFDAAFGGAGPHINVVTRAGTNIFSGGAFAFAQTEQDRQELGGFAGGPVAPNRTFLFGDVGHTRFSDDVPFRDSGTDAGVRLDHNLGDTARLTARYSLSDGIRSDQRSQLFGASLRQAVGTASNDVRFAVSRSDELRPLGLADATGIYLADTFAWAAGDHALDVGGEWQSTDLEFIGERATRVLSAFVQDNWQAAPTLSVQAGLRLDWFDPPPDLGDGDTHVLPRLGIAWQPREQSETVVRGAYGRFAETRVAFAGADPLDQWSVGAARQWGRTRTIEVSYEGSRLREAGRFNGLVFEIEQRSEVGLTGHVAYTIGRTEFDGNDPQDDAEDTHHRLTGALVWVLPFGDERLLFNDGLLRDVFGDMQLNGVLVLENMRRDRDTGRRGDHRTLDLGLLKDVRVGGRTLQLRFETFNALDRANRRPFFYPDLLTVPTADSQGRRYQVGLRFLY
jgi:hypothetical protein